MLKIKLWACTLLMLFAFVNQIDGYRNQFSASYPLPTSVLALNRANNELQFIYVTGKQSKTKGLSWKYTKNISTGHLSFGPNQFLPGINYGTYPAGILTLKIFAISQFYVTALTTLLFLYYRWRAWLFLRRRRCQDVCKNCDYDLQGTADSDDTDQQQGKCCPECGAFNGLKS